MSLGIFAAGYIGPIPYTVTLKNFNKPTMRSGGMYTYNEQNKNGRLTRAAI